MNGFNKKKTTELKGLSEKKSRINVKKNKKEKIQKI